MQNAKSEMMETLLKAGTFLFFEDLQEAESIDVQCDETDLAKLLEITKETWNELGRLEPHWSVMTDQRYVASGMSAAKETEFYATGAVEVKAWARALARNGRTLAGTGRFLELGCGLGRVSEHLAAIVGRYVGVDVSASHLAGARARAEQLALQNADFLLLEDLLRSEDRYDGIASYLVFQHNPPPVMLWLLSVVLSKLTIGGYAMLQIPTRRFDGYSFDLEAYLRAAEQDVRPRAMEMHAVPERHIHRAAHQSGCVLLESFPDGRIGAMGLSQTFIFERLGSEDRSSAAAMEVK